MLEPHALPRYLGKPGNRKKQRRFGHRMGKDMEHGRRIPGDSPDADSHIDISNLGCGGKCHHPVGTLRVKGLHRPHHDAGDAQHQKNVLQRHLFKHLNADHSPVNLEQQENIALGNHRAHDRAGGRRRCAVGIGHPEIKWKQSAFYAESDGQDSDRQRDNHKVVGILRQQRYLLLHRNHQKMARNIIQKHHAQKVQTGTQQVQNHIPDGCQCGTSQLTDNQHAAAAERQDLQKYISGKNIIGPQHGHGRSRHQIDQGIVEIDLALIHILIDEAPSSQHRAENNAQEDLSHQCFQNARPDLIAPGCGKLSHRIGEGTSRHGSIPENGSGQPQQENLKKYRIVSRRFSGKHRAEHTGKQAQHNREKRKIRNKVHVTCPPSHEAKADRCRPDSAYDTGDKAGWSETA